MKDNSAFTQSVFDKSERIFKKRKKRNKILVSFLSTSLCFLLVFGILNSFPFAKKAFDAEMAPTDNYYSEIMDGSSKGEGLINGDQADSIKISEREITSAEDIPSFEEKMPTMIEVKSFSSTVSIYRDKNDMEEIKSALDASSEKLQDTVAVGKITLFYEDEKLSIYVGNGFFEIYN